MTIPLASEQPTMTPLETFKALELGRSSGYEAIRRGEIPALRFGRRIVIPTAALRKMLGLEQ